MIYIIGNDGTPVRIDSSNIINYNAGDNISIENNTISYSEAYSTSEHFTGKYWIDGKPIYRIVKVISVGVNATVETNLSSLNIDTLMAPHGWVKQPSGNFVYVPYYYNSSDLGACFYRSSTGVLVCKSGSGAGAGTWTIILEYTKK